MDYPDNAIYLYLDFEQDDEDRELDIFKRDRYRNSGISSTIINGAGYGKYQRDGTVQKFVIISRDCPDADYIDRYVIYLDED